jgi:hypothetical protein
LPSQTSNKLTFVEIYELSEPGGRVILFEIPPAPLGLPVAWKGHFYGRDGESLVPLNLWEIERIRRQSTIEDWSVQTCPNATIADLDPVAITQLDTERDGLRVAFNGTFRAFGFDLEWDVGRYGRLLEVSGGKERIRRDAGCELEVPTPGRLMLIPLFQKHCHFTQSPTLSTLLLHVRTTFLAKPVAGSLARSPDRLARRRSALRQNHPRPELGG